MSCFIHAAVAAERTRLADALHDGALQLLITARQELQELRGGGAEAIERLETHLQNATLELRALTSAMHEESLDELPLTVAMQCVAYASASSADCSSMWRSRTAPP